jgi:hypothetical protein
MGKTRYPCMDNMTLQSRPSDGLALRVCTCYSDVLPTTIGGVFVLTGRAVAGPVDLDHPALPREVGLSNLFNNGSLGTAQPAHEFHGRLGLSRRILLVPAQPGHDVPRIPEPSCRFD